MCPTKCKKYPKTVSVEPGIEPGTFRFPVHGPAHWAGPWGSPLGWPHGQDGLAHGAEALEPFDLQFTIGSEVEVDAFRREQEGEVWRYLAFAAGLFLLLELFVAWWFGRKA